MGRRRTTTAASGCRTTSIGLGRRTSAAGSAGSGPLGDGPHTADRPVTADRIGRGLVAAGRPVSEVAVCCPVSAVAAARRLVIRAVARLRPPAPGTPFTALTGRQPPAAGRLGQQLTIVALASGSPATAADSSPASTHPASGTRTSARPGSGTGTSTGAGPTLVASVPATYTRRRLAVAARLPATVRACRRPAASCLASTVRVYGRPGVTGPPRVGRARRPATTGTTAASPLRRGPTAAAGTAGVIRA